jgi:hypothetical protein
LLQYRAKKYNHFRKLSFLSKTVSSLDGGYFYAHTVLYKMGGGEEEKSESEAFPYTYRAAKRLRGIPSAAREVYMYI